jgi:hypothetical protein
MTYPLPSRGYQELVCTAGITEAGEWVRLYPIDYRYRPRNQQFKKYQWIEVELDPKGSGSDHRKESRRPVLESITILGERLSTKDGWKERRAIIDKIPHRTRKQLEEAYAVDQTSLGLKQAIACLRSSALSVFLRSMSQSLRMRSQTRRRVHRFAKESLDFEARSIRVCSNWGLNSGLRTMRLDSLRWYWNSVSLSSEQAILRHSRS